MEENEAFPLSEKYIDFLQHIASTEFLEGTTFAGKTTVGIPKFMFRVANDDSSKPSIISGLDLGTIEKNIINDYQNLQKSCQNFEDNDYKIYKTFEGANLESIIMLATKNPKMATKYLENIKEFLD